MRQNWEQILTGDATGNFSDYLTFGTETSLNEVENSSNVSPGIFCDNFQVFILKYIN
jgi:hypothetical protein